VDAHPGGKEAPTNKPTNPPHVDRQWHEEEDNMCRKKDQYVKLMPTFSISFTAF
jgi:hypothetical protein